jgi:hypothetical protein
MGKPYNHVIHIRSSANRTTWFIKHAGKAIPLDNCTRWNSWSLILYVDKEKAGLQLYVEYYEDDFSKDDILSTSEWIHLRTIRDFLQYFSTKQLYFFKDIVRH